MPNDINIQLRKLPFGVLSKLEKYLEPPGDKDWKALISVMPAGRYDQSKVDYIKARGSTFGQTCTGILLQDLCQRCVKLKELGCYLKKIENYQALEALGWPPEPVIIKTQPECAILQEGSPLCLRVEAVGYPLPNYQWYRNEQEMVGEELNELRIEKATTSANGTYKCIVSNDVNSVCSDEVKVCISKPMPQKPEEPSVIVNTKPVIIIQPVSATILHGQRHMLHCEATGQPPMTYQWYKNGLELLNTNSPTLDLPAFGEENIGRYCCKVSNTSGGDISVEAELALQRVERPRNVASDKVALLMGNQDYTAAFHEALQAQGQLQHTIADTKTLGSLLHRDDMGFNVLSLGNLTRQEMVKGIGEYVNLLSEDCYAFFYYAGHGFEVNGKHYLVPVDAPQDWTQEDAICVQWILEIIWKARPKFTTIILDMCRVRPNSGGVASFEEYDYPKDLEKIVIGFATCSQSESYERRDESNGIYMQHLKKHICRDVKIEDILHDVTTDVENDTTRCIYTQDQRPEYVVRGGGYYSLRDPVEPHGNRSAERWLKAHKLPEKRIIQFEEGISVEVRFEHSDWLSNSVNILVGVIDSGMVQNCYAYIYQISNGLEMHFPIECQNIVVEPEPECYDQDRDVVPRSKPQAARPETTTAHIPVCERATGMFHLQRLHDNVTVTIALEYEIHGIKSTKYKVVAFPEADFGLAQVFGNNWR